jgi:hypothetical protein
LDFSQSEILELQIFGGFTGSVGAMPHAETIGKKILNIVKQPFNECREQAL